MGLASSQHACTRTRGRDGRTDHNLAAARSASRKPPPRPRESHGHAMRKPARRRTAEECCKHAGPAPLRHGSVGCRARVERPVGSVGRVGKMRPARCPASPSQRPARPRAPWDHLLHLPWAQGRVAAVRDRERPPNALAAVASCLALQLVDTSPSPATRA